MGLAVAPQSANDCHATSRPAFDERSQRLGDGLNESKQGAAHENCGGKVR